MIRNNIIVKIRTICDGARAAYGICGNIGTAP